MPGRFVTVEDARRRVAPLRFGAMRGAPDTIARRPFRIDACLGVQKLACGVDYVVRANSCRVHEFFGLTRAWHVLYGEVLEVDGVGLLREGREDGLAEAAFRPVVLDRDYLAARRLCCSAQCLAVYRLDGVGVDDADGHPALLQFPSRLYGFVDRYARCDHGHHVVFGGSNYLAAADGELFRGVIDHRRLRAQRAQEHDTVPIGHLGDELGGLVGIAGL